jgi:hypothetical protein
VLVGVNDGKTRQKTPVEGVGSLLTHAPDNLTNCEVTMIEFARKHWRGEYSLPRSYWLHGFFFGALIGLGGAFLTAALKDAEVTGSPYVLPLGITCILYALCWLVFYIWVTGGTWRSATQRGGFWARTAKVALVLGWLGFVSQTVQEFSPKHPSTHTDASTPSKTGTGLKPSTATDEWVTVANWNIRYDSSQNSGGTPKGCFMFRITGDSGLRVGFYDSDWYFITFSNKWLEENITEKTKYDLDLKIGKNPWTVTAKAFALGTTKMLGFQTQQKEFLSQLASNNYLTVFQSSKQVAEYNISGAKDGLAAMLTCQEAHENKSLNRS